MASRKLKTGSFGACTFDSMSPPKLAVDTKAMNLVIPFGEALKLNLAIDECIRKLNRDNRATTEGKGAALMMIVHFDKGRIRVQEGNLRAGASKGRRHSVSHDRDSVAHGDATRRA
jgi:hypothetical protein